VCLFQLGPRKPPIEVGNVKSQILAKFIHRGGGTGEWLFFGQFIHFRAYA
jgi:hypothetical protein